MNFQFNIVYVPGTVRLLVPFVFGLLEWSGCSFRLVANGCSPEEVGLLQRLCSRNLRLDFLALPFEKTVEHGQALSHLQSLEQSDHFCFMDSDILATGDFMNQFIPHLDRHTGVFSCSSICYRDAEKVLLASSRRVFGRYHTTEQGVCLGSTYFAIYDNLTLTRVIKSEGIDFNRYRWVDIRPCHQASLAKIGLDRQWYDTGKLLNLLLLIQGKSLVFVETPALLHIGGMSVPNMPRRRPHRRSITKRLMRSVQRLSRKLNPGLKTKASLQAEHSVEQRRRRRRTAISRYFGHLLQSLSEERPTPVRPTLGDAEIEERVDSITIHLAELCRRNREEITRLNI